MSESSEVEVKKEISTVVTEDGKQSEPKDRNGEEKKKKKSKKSKKKEEEEKKSDEKTDEKNDSEEEKKKKAAKRKERKQKKEEELEMKKMEEEKKKQEEMKMEEEKKKEEMKKMEEEKRKQDEMKKMEEDKKKMEESKKETETSSETYSDSSSSSESTDSEEEKKRKEDKKKKEVKKNKEEKAKNKDEKKNEGETEKDISQNDGEKKPKKELTRKPSWIHASSSEDELEEPKPKSPSVKPLAANVLKEGYLEKKGVIRRSWTRRWMVLMKSKEILYYKTEKDAIPKGVISLRNAAIYPHVHLKHIEMPSYFNLRIGNSDFLMRAGDAEEKKEWVKAIKANIVVDTDTKMKRSKIKAFLGVVQSSEENNATSLTKS